MSLTARRAGISFFIPMASDGTLWWFGAGTLPHGSWRHWLYRGRHHPPRGPLGYFRIIETRMVRMTGPPWREER